MKGTRTPLETYDYVKEVGVKKSGKTVKQTLANSILAGIFIALAGFTAAMASHGIGNFGLAKLVSGLIFPVGIILVVICGAELFTGNHLMSVAFFEKKINGKHLAKNWTLVFIGNFIGILIMGLILYGTGLLESNDGLLGAYAVKVAYKKAHLTMLQAFTRGILCNILVCIAVWGSYSARSTSGKFLMLHLPVMAFIIGGFEHSIANMYYFIMGLLAKMSPAFVEASHLTTEMVNMINLPNIFMNLVVVTLGNIVGGALVVGGLYYLSNHKKQAVSSSKSFKA